MNLDQSSVGKLTGLSKVKNSKFLQAVIVYGSLARDFFFQVNGISFIYLDASMESFSG